MMNIAKIMTYLFSTVKKKVTKEALAELHDFGTTISNHDSSAEKYDSSLHKV